MTMTPRLRLLVSSIALGAGVLIAGCDGPYDSPPPSVSGVIDAPSADAPSAAFPAPPPARAPGPVAPGPKGPATPHEIPGVEAPAGPPAPAVPTTPAEIPGIPAPPTGLTSPTDSPATTEAPTTSDGG